MKRVLVLVAVAVVGLWVLQDRLFEADPQPGPEASASPERPSGRYDSEQLATLCPEIVESSGLIVDPKGRLWTINDGPDPVLFRIRPDGGCRATPVAGATLFDWEALARNDRYLYIGDIGDNRAARSSVSVFSVPLRSLVRGPQVEAEYVFTYPDGPQDAESMFVDPRDGALYVITKSDRPIVYRAPLEEPGTPTSLEPVGRVKINELLPGPTGADMSASGELILATYGAAYLYPGERPLGAVLGRRPKRIGLPVVVQREAIAFDRDGLAFLWTSEGRDAPLYRTAPES